MNVSDINRCAGLFRKSCDTVIEGDRLAVNVSGGLRINDYDALTLHNAHHGLNGCRIDYELLLRDRAAKLKPVTPAGCPENELTRNEVGRSCLGKTVDDHRIEIRLMVRDDDDRALMLNELHVGLYLDVRESTDQGYDDVRANKSKPEFARDTTYIIVTRCLRTGGRITLVFSHFSTPMTIIA